MELGGKTVPEYKPCGKEWTAAMMELDKEAIVAILKTKCEEVDRCVDCIQEYREADKKKDALEGVPDQGLQIERYFIASDGSLYKNDTGMYCLFLEAERFHHQLQEQVGKNFSLTAEISKLKKQIDIHKKVKA